MCSIHLYIFIGCIICWSWKFIILVKQKQRVRQVSLINWNLYKKTRRLIKTNPDQKSTCICIDNKPRENTMRKLKTEEKMSLWLSYLSNIYLRLINIFGSSMVQLKRCFSFKGHEQQSIFIGEGKFVSSRDRTLDSIGVQTDTTELHLRGHKDKQLTAIQQKH